MTRILDGVSVLEIGSFITAPHAAMMLADLGAETIKVERPGSGDSFRTFQGGSYSPQFRAYNRSKKSITVDLTRPEGTLLLRELAQRADVLLENFRPGFMDEIGLGYDVLSAINPRLVYCSITGFGPEGPYRSRPSYDTVGQGLSGLLGLYVGIDDPRIAGTSISDAVTGMYAAYAVLGGLLRRERVGHGVRIETNMLASTIAFIENAFVAYSLSGTLPGLYGKSEANQSFALRCADDKLVAVHLSSPPKFWLGLVAATGSVTLGTDPRFTERPNRTRNYEALRQELARLFAQHPRTYWLEKLESYDVPFSPVYTLDEVERDPQVEFMHLFRDLVHPIEGATRTVGRPVWFDGDDGREAAFAPPQIGEHSSAILASLGYTDDDIARLRSDRII